MTKELVFVNTHVLYVASSRHDGVVVVALVLVGG